MCKNLDNSSAQGKPIEKRFRSKIWAKMTAEIPNIEKMAIFSKTSRIQVKIFTRGFFLFAFIFASSARGRQKPIAGGMGNPPLRTCSLILLLLFRSTGHHIFGRSGRQLALACVFEKAQPATLHPDRQPSCLPF